MYLIFTKEEADFGIIGKYNPKYVSRAVAKAASFFTPAM